MPDVIKLLPDSVANQIAAGEVIQRPASVVKELMENSVDAGAKAISVIIKDSGRTLIQVTDDGTGMSETDARLAFERHSTSKITSAQDLFSITTKGFRGEALASIAAVSMVELKTRRADDEAGTLIIINSSKVEKQEPCSCPKGSSFSVKNLFYNTPARRKFLKSESTEMRHIITEFQKIAIAHPDIRFTLHHNDSEIYNLIPANHRQRIIGIFGKSINNSLITLDTVTNLVTIKGFAGKPENARRSPGEQFFFVNNRFMKHPYFHKAVVEAYQNILPPDTVPSYFIFLEVDPSTIDINIHPTKTEVKFEDERTIWHILLASVREALGRFNIMPSIDFDTDIPLEIPVGPASHTLPRPPEIKINPNFNPFGNEENYSRKMFFDEKLRTAGWEKLYPDSGQSVTGITLPEPERKLLQIKNKYIVCPVKSGLMFIDQKRAHERILYERYLSAMAEPRFASQAEMFPVTLELNPADYSLLKEVEAELRQIGFSIVFKENNEITVAGLPSDSESSDPAGLIEIVIEEYRRTCSDPTSGAKEKIAAAMASASAIPYGRSLTRAEMEDLFDTLFACSSPNYSPSGKPAVFIMTLDEIDKRFK
ncbi:MAG: DNA mismatch repair endonuclease MutL [Bacteroidales bacterium]|nr:DNA mismatch repair endonuclease MutL [Bacteroidales bacterium]